MTSLVQIEAEWRPSLEIVVFFVFFLASRELERAWCSWRMITLRVALLFEFRVSRGSDCWTSPRIMARYREFVEGP